MKNLLVTGGAGFIGSHLAEYLLNQGHRVTVLDNLYLGRRENVASFRLNPRFIFLKKDLLDFAETRRIFLKNEYDRVYHLAANSDIGRGAGSHELDLRLNFETTRSVLEAMAAADCPEIVFASTSAIYQPGSAPLAESSGPFFPVSFYGASKLAAEGFISAYSHAHGFRAWIVRFANVVGGRATHGVILNFVRALRKNPKKLAIFFDGRQSKPYIHVSDLINGIEFFTKINRKQLDCVNLGTADQITVRGIARIIAREMNLRPQFRYTGQPGWTGDVKNYRYDLRKIHRLGWQAKLSARQAVERAVKEIVAQESVK